MSAKYLCQICSNDFVHSHAVVPPPKCPECRTADSVLFIEWLGEQVSHSFKPQENEMNTSTIECPCCKSNIELRVMINATKDLYGVVVTGLVDEGLFQMAIREGYRELSENAITKFPSFPRDAFKAIAIITEELGEVAKACLQRTYESDDSGESYPVNPMVTDGEAGENIIAEANQLTAMAIRFRASVGFMLADKAFGIDQSAYIQVPDDE